MPDDMNLEVDPQPGPPAPEPVAPPVEPPPQADPDEAQAVEVPNAGKHVPLAALKAVRKENQSLKEKAARADQLEAWVNQNKPKVDFLDNNPQLLRRPEPTPQPQPSEDPELREIAQTFDFYRTDGQFDLDKAAKHRDRENRRAQQIAERTVAPLAMASYRAAAEQNWRTAVSQKLPNGTPIDQQLLTATWLECQRENPAILADPRAVAVVVNNVLMAQMRNSPLNPQQPQPPARPPVVTENVGARPNGNSQMTDTQRAIVANRGIDDKKFAELTKGFTPGRMNILED